MVLAVPVTRSRLSHALTIRAGGRVIGAIHSFSPSQSRTIDTEYELGPNEMGLPRDLVPQNVERREIRIARYDLYPRIMEEVFGSEEIVNLIDQYRPFSLREVWAAPGQGLGAVAAVTGLSVNTTVSPSLPNGYNLNATYNESLTPGTALFNAYNALASGAQPRQYEYTGCWFSDLGRSMDAKGDRLVSVDATVVYLNKRRVL